MCIEWIRSNLLNTLLRDSVEDGGFIDGRLSRETNLVKKRVKQLKSEVGLMMGFLRGRERWREWTRGMSVEKRLETERQRKRDRASWILWKIVRRRSSGNRSK